MTRWILMLALCACHAAPRTTNAAPERDELAARRAQIIEWLGEYAEAGVYPTDDSGWPLSVFRDTHGVRCPMAEVIYRSGHGDLVDAVVRENNAARLADVHDGPLYDWMLGSGLTGEEIAMVQGVMEIGMQWQLEQPDRPEPSETTILARARIRGRLETAVRALRDATPHSLEVATSRLPAHRVPVVGAIQGRVLPRTLVGAN